VDHPATQQWKRERLREVALAVPANLRFVPVDFQRDTLAAALASHGFSRTQPAFFSWLGVTYYLTREAIFDTLRYVALLEAASEIVFDFALEDVALSAAFRASIARLMRSMVRRGEPWLARFEPAALQERLRALGFEETFYLSEALATERYLRGRSEALELGEAVQVMAAWSQSPASISPRCRVP
jgi:methyltransferase (TIGR00027 family)